MKTSGYILIFLGTFFFSLSGLRAQKAITFGTEKGATVQSSVQCNVITPIGITKLTDMFFGTIVSGNAGSITLPPDGNTPSTSGNVNLNTSQGILSAAKFEVNDGLSGAATQRFYTGFTVSLPTTDITLVNEEGKTMRVGNFTSNPSTTGYGAFTNGTGLLTVGATLFVNESQGLGKYVSTSPFPVTVNFH